MEGIDSRGALVAYVNLLHAIEVHFIDVLIQGMWVEIHENHGVPSINVPHFCVNSSNVVLTLILTFLNLLWDIVFTKRPSLGFSFLNAICLCEPSVFFDHIVSLITFPKIDNTIFAISRDYLDLNLLFFFLSAVAISYQCDRIHILLSQVFLQVC